MKSILLSLVVSAVCIPCFALVGPGQRQVSISDQIFSQRLFAALSLVKDPAVTQPTSDRVLLSSDGQSISCFNGTVKVSGMQVESSNCDLNVNVDGVGNIQGQLAQLLYQALSRYQAAKPNDMLVSQEMELYGGSIELSSDDPQQTVTLPAEGPAEKLQCSVLRVGGGPDEYTCDLFSLYGDVPSAKAQAILTQLKADPNYASGISADTSMVMGEGFQPGRVTVLTNIVGCVEAILEYQKAPASGSNIQITRYIIITADPATNGQGYQIDSVYVGRD